jgi:hypothetical protein
MGIILNAKCCVFRILMDWEIGDKKRDKAASKKKLKKKKEQKWERDETTKMEQFSLTK